MTPALWRPPLEDLRPLELAAACRASGLLDHAALLEAVIADLPDAMRDPLGRDMARWLEDVETILTDAREAMRADLELRNRPGPTPVQLETIAALRANVAQQRRDKRRISKAGVCGVVGLDPKTLNVWIANGWLEWPPA